MAPKKDYTPHQMSLAIEAVKKGESCSSAAKKYGVPRMTLRNKVTGKSPASCSMGPPTILSSQEEALLIQWLFAMAERHSPVGKEQLLDSVQHIIKADKRENPFVNDRPGRKWFDLFLKRHPELSQRVSQNLTTSREAVTEQKILEWFSEIAKYIEDSQLSEALRDPSRVFNTDESAFYLNPQPGRVLVKRGDKNIYSTSGNEKENLTVLLTANAAGQLAPPMVVFSYERIPRNIAENIPIDWGIGRSESGWMCGSTFFEYMTNIFYPWLIENKIKLPIIFFLDGHASHLTKHLSDFCSLKQIEIIALYPNSTHLLQPMDVAVFRPLKLFWRQQTRKWKTENLGQQVRKENFAPILKCALENITVECIRNGFRRAGLFPFGPDFIDFTKLNVNNRSLTTKDSCASTQQQLFLCQLEKEIVEIFTQSKLDTFNKCFYLPCAELAAELPDEDLTLYTIWAKYKNLCQVVNSGRATEAMNNGMHVDPVIREIQEDVNKVVEESSQSDNQNERLLEVIVAQKTPSKIIPSTSFASHISQDKTATITEPLTSQDFGAHMLKEKGVIVPSPFKKALFWPQPSTDKKRRTPKEKIPSAVTSKLWRDYHEKKDLEKKTKEAAKEERKQKLQEKRELKEAGKKSCDTNKAPRKLIGQKQNVKRRRRLSVTSSDTDDSDVTYAETGESDVEDQSEDEETPLIDLRRKIKYEERRSYGVEKNQEGNGTPKRILKVDDVEINVKNNKPGILSADVNNEVEMVCDTHSDINRKERNATENKVLQTSLAEPSEKLSKVIVEELPQIEETTQYCPVSSVVPSSSKQLSQNRLTINDYVLVTWNERPYPGQIIGESQEGLLISCMKKSSGFWRWPVIKDIQLYSWDNVVCQIRVPKFIKKGCFTIPEIDNL